MRWMTAITTFAALALGAASTGYAQSDHAMPIPPTCCPKFSSITGR